MLIKYIAGYLEYLDIERGLAKNTILAYRTDLYSLSEFLSNLGLEKIEDISRMHLNMYIKDLYDKQYTPRSITREIASIKGFFKWMGINDYLKHNPALAIEQPKLPKRLPKVLSMKEINELLAIHMTDMEKAVLELLYAAGLRVSELTDININDIDINAKYIRCLGKGSKERIVPINNTAKKY